MSKALDHKCKLCGKMYHACDSCRNVESYVPWRMVACSMECYQALVAFTDYRNGNITKNELRNVLNEYDFSHRKVIPELQEIFEDVLTSPEDPEVFEEDEASEIVSAEVEVETERE